MKIYRWEDFLKLPAGTLYCGGVQWSFGGICVKGETQPNNDFLTLDLQWIDSQNSEEALDRLEIMLESDASFPLETAYGRDGLFDGQIFLVYEVDDLVALIRFCQAAMDTAIFERITARQ